LIFSGRPFFAFFTIFRADFFDKKDKSGKKIAAMEKWDGKTGRV
jgi:hypothetical protein